MDLAVKFLHGAVTTCSNQAFDLFMSCEKNMQALHNQRKKLSRTKKMVERRTKEEKKKGKEVNDEVEDWLEDIKTLEHDIEDLDSRYKSMYKVFDTWSPVVWIQYSISKDAKKLQEDAENLTSLGNFSEVASEPSSTGYTERPGGAGLGMDRVLEQLKSYMEGNDKVAVIAICGMGRTGKTTVLEHFNNEFIPKNRDDIIWVNMDEIHNVNDIQKVLIQKIGLNWIENKSCEECAADLFNYLKDKRYLLIFENVWERLDFKTIGIPVRNSKGGKIILTTRSLYVCGQMQAKVVSVKKLNWENSWSLFLENAGETAQKLIARHRGTIGIIAKALVKKCGGLPEAIIKIGHAVATKENIDQWEYLLKLLDTTPWKVPGMQELLSKLKFSYDRLDPKSKAILLYCSLYPEGFSTDKGSIADYCIAEELINSYSEGEDKFGELKNLCLLESADYDHLFILNPMVRAMALWIACDCGQNENKWLVQAGKKIGEAPKAYLWSDAQRISLMKNDIDSLSEVPDCPNLETLLLHENLKLERIHDDFFLNMPKLRVLDLSETGIKHLPAGIAKLVSLRYLDVSTTEISSLPEELGALVNLRFLVLDGMPNLETIPSGLIAKFIELRLLFMKGSYNKWKVDDAGTGVDFEELNNLKQLTAFAISIANPKMLEKLAGSNRLASCTRSIEVNGCQILKCISKNSGWGSFKDLRSLRIVSCNDFEEVTIDGNYLQKLEYLGLVKLQKMKIVWSQGCFDNLNTLFVEECDSIESLVYCNNEVNQAQNKVKVSVFSNLKNLFLYDLPQLKSLCSGRSTADLPILEYLDVKNCPNLKKLNMAVDQLQILCGSESWWRSVEPVDFDAETTEFRYLKDNN